MAVNFRRVIASWFKSYLVRNRHDFATVNTKNEETCISGGNSACIHGMFTNIINLLRPNSEQTHIHNYFRSRPKHSRDCSGSRYSFFIRWLDQREKPDLKFGEAKSEDLGKRHHLIEVLNKGRSVARGCEAKLSLDISKEDVLAIEESAGYTTITPSTFRKLENMNVSWNTMRAEIDIKPTDHADLNILDVFEPYKSEIDQKMTPLQIQIPTERGGDSVLVSLIPRKYTGTLKIVCENHDAISKSISIEYDESKRDVTIKLR